ncbi:hypothetical protein AB0B74_08000 [Micromonospora parva]|uniref:hypothetical protein n=1 Tax=Micromonospora parva TaxID=1464048 RepID=UPI00340EAA15
MSVSLRTWMLKAAPDASETATALLVMVFNLSIAFGALIGGLTAGAAGATGVLWVAGCLTLLTAITVAVIRRDQSR